MKILILIVLLSGTIYSQESTKSPTFQPKFIYVRPDGSEYARIDGIEGWVVLKASNKPNPFFNAGDVKPKEQMIYNEKGEKIVNVNTSTPLTAATNSQSDQSINSVFSPELLTFIVYPNPANENSSAFFKLESSKNVKIEIYTKDGKFLSLIKDSIFPEGENTISIPTDKYYSGTYLLCITIDGKRKMEFVEVVK